MDNLQSPVEPDASTANDTRIVVVFMAGLVVLAGLVLGLG